jgi:hypothetical protein
MRGEDGTAVVSDSDLYSDDLGCNLEYEHGY